MKKYIFTAAAIVVLTAAGLLIALPGEAQPAQLQLGPKLQVPERSLPDGTGFKPAPIDLSHLTKQTTPDEN